MKLHYETVVLPLLFFPPRFDITLLYEIVVLRFAVVAFSLRDTRHYTQLLTKLFIPSRSELRTKNTPSPRFDLITVSPVGVATGQKSLVNTDRLSVLGVKCEISRPQG